MATRERPDLHGIERWENGVADTAFAPTSAIIVDVDGVLSIIDLAGQTRTLPLKGGVMHAIRCTQINTAGTTTITITACRLGYHEY